MTSKGDNLKTNEFLRLRKLRLQQVREQSKDIAKKIRQRAKVEQLRQITNIDTNKEKEYLQRQEKLVNRLEQLYTKGVQSVGAGHKNACEVNEAVILEKKDLSTLRGKQAASVLKKKKQEKLDEQKKLLDRKLQAREVANVLSREKFAVVANTLTKSSSGKNINEEHDIKNNINEKVPTENIESHKEKSDAKTKNDMSTQWEFEEIPNEWEPNIPTLPISNDDSLKNVADDNVEKIDSPKSRRLNLFALSDEMPASLRGGVTSVPDDRHPIKPSLTLVSEYLQNRGLRLREPDLISIQKKNSDELQSIKQTLLRTRASRTDGNVCPNICHVLDEQVIPVPCWIAPNSCEFCSNVNENTCRYYKNRINSNFASNNKNPFLKPYSQPLTLSYKKSKQYQMYYRSCQGTKIPVSGRSSDVERSSKLDDTNRMLKKKDSVTMYDHNTRDIRDLPRNVDKLVVRDECIDDDAYSQALKEISVVDYSANHNLQQEARNRLAMTRQNVDKEYRDTLAFLNSLPKEKPVKSIRKAYMDADREQELKDRHQNKLQQEYKKIEKQCNKHQCKQPRNKLAAREQNRRKSKSPVTIDIDNNVIDKDFQYSWLPIPESDDNMAIHNIPNITKDDKSGNTVKFSSVDTYHEYRSRHKHTPPTKDVDNEPKKRVVEAVIIQENSNDSVDSSETDTSSVDNLQLQQDSLPGSKAGKDKQLADAERIIIYKVVESKRAKKNKTKNKLHNGNKIDGKQMDIGSQDTQNLSSVDPKDQIKTNTVSFTQLKEGVYKSVSSNGDNIASLYFSDDQQGRYCQDARNSLIGKGNDTDASTRIENDGNNINRKTKPCDKCTDSHKHPSAAASTSSFKTAINHKAKNILLDDGYIQLVNEGGQDNGKFYVGASGFLKDDAYEVIIQLRKKDAENINKNASYDKKKETRSSLENNTEDENYLVQPSPVVQSKNNSSNNLIEFENKNVVEGPSNLLSTKNKLGPLETSAIPEDKIIESRELNEIDHHQSKVTVEPPQLIDKGISTTFCDEFAIPDYMPKLDPISRPANSVYTQTTQNSPIPRPVLMHLSSSTSTTYMSPPELVLPRYLRKGSSETCDDTYEPISSNINSQNVKITTSCKIRRCGKCKISDKDPKADTPQNTTRSEDQTTNKNKQYKNCIRTESKHNNVRSYKCKNHNNRSKSKICSKHKFKRNPSENKRLHSGSNYSTLSNNKSRITNKFDKITLNPVIENYVKTLLALNKEGLKAIEVVNQECSVVNTPGSSVIDVPSNAYQNRAMCNKISLQQIKNSLEEQLLTNVLNKKNISKSTVISTGIQTEKNCKLYKSNKKRPLYKVKSFNISKHFMKINKSNRRFSTQSTVTTTSPYCLNSKKEKNNYTYSSNCKSNSQSETSPTLTQMNNIQEISNSHTNKDSRKSFKSECKTKPSKTVTKMDTGNRHYSSKAELRHETESYPFPSHTANIRSHSSESETSHVRKSRNLSTPPISISTQTKQVDSEVEFMKLAENKLQNMEKIADLTEKCTKRLSNLAKVLEEVRRNKSLAYSQISTSDCTSDSDHRSDKNMQSTNSQTKTFNPSVEIPTLPDTFMQTRSQEQNKPDINVPAYVPILMDLPKPDTFKTPSLSFSDESNREDARIIMDHQYIKNRGKPPPALTRINLKNVPAGLVIPHELSTVVEVESPMSIKLKSHTSQIDNKPKVPDNEIADDIHLNKMDDVRVDTHSKPVDLNYLIINNNMSKRRPEIQSTDTSDDSKVKMMDLNHFNEIMLKPFISLNDYAKQYNLEELDRQTSFNGISKDINVNEELSSLHSEASLPDVMAELLKRNLISEPFKFETTSNINSTTVSSESTLSLLALSRAHKETKKSAMLVKNKENIAETSVSLSVSSNPDLEHAFQRLGMGWASSTLKKTKERLALSSSSNTSSSSIPQFKVKSFNYQDIPEMSLLNISNKEEVTKQQGANSSDVPKNALQQTALTNSMTVKEFLANELANKITFSNKTNRNNTDEFISLYETKIPDEIKKLSEKAEVNEKSVDSLPSGTNNRARTSTPVQIYKSMTYHSTSSSNTSNGLFSNADDLSSVKGTSNSIKNHSTSDKDDLTIPNYSLKMRKVTAECSKSD